MVKIFKAEKRFVSLILNTVGELYNKRKKNYQKENRLIRNKLFLIFGILVAGLSAFLVQSVMMQAKLVRQMTSVQQLCRFSISIGSMVHELQKERARSVAFLDSAGASTAVKEELTAQQKRTDGETARVKEHLHHYVRDKISSEFNDRIAVIGRNIDGLKDVRGKINASQVSSRQAVEYYTEMNDSFLSALFHIPVLMANTEFPLGTLAYINFLYAKENAGVERAVLYDGFLKDEFESWHIKKFISAVTAQETFSTLFLSYATAAQRRYYDDKIQHPSFGEVKKIRDGVLQKMAEGHLGIDPAFWVKTVSAKIDVLKGMESYLVDDLTRRARVGKEQAQRSLVLLLLVTGIPAFGVFAIFYLMVQRIVNSLDLVVDAAEQVRRGEFKAHITASATDEVGVLIDSFNRMTEELRQTTVSKSYVDNIIANMMNSLVVVTLEGEIMSVNKTTCDLLGYQEKEMEGSSFKQLFAAGKFSSERSWIDALKGGIQNEEMVYRSKEGKEVPILLSSSLLKDNDGRPQGIICVAQDITERKEIEEILRVKEEYSRTILETAKDAFIAINEDDIIMGWNPHAEVVFGWPREEVLGKSLSGTIIPKHYRKAHGEGMKRFIKTGERRILNTTVEVTGLHRDGREFPIELTIWAIRINEKYQFNAFVRDITERKKAQTEYVRLAAALQAAGDAIMITDTDAVIQYVNPAFERMTGYPIDEVVGQKPSILKSGRQDAEFYEEMWDTLRRGKVWTGTLVNRRKDGTFYDAEETISLVRDASFKIVNYAAVQRDITQRKRMENELKTTNENLSKEQKVVRTIFEDLQKTHKDLADKEKTLRNMFVDLQKTHDDLKQTQRQLLQSEKLASIGLLAAGVAHEINNPLGFISSNLQTLEEYVVKYARLWDATENLKKSIKDKSWEQADSAVIAAEQLEENMSLSFIVADIGCLLKETKEGIEKITKIVRDLRNFAREDKEVMEMVNIEEVIDNILSIVGNEIKYKADVEKDYGSVPLLKCNSRKIGQVFVNLFVNAVQAIEGKGTVRIKTYQKDAQACVEVQDTGRGMDEQTLKRVFDPFFTTKPVGEGTGLGLSISYDIIKEHGGDIIVRSEVGKGTTFTVMLPINSEPSSAPSTE